MGYFFQVLQEHIEAIPLTNIPLNGCRALKVSLKEKKNPSHVMSTILYGYYSQFRVSSIWSFMRATTFQKSIVTLLVWMISLLHLIYIFIEKIYCIQSFMVYDLRSNHRVSLCTNILRAYAIEFLVCFLLFKVSLVESILLWWVSYLAMITYVYLLDITLFPSS